MSPPPAKQRPACDQYREAALIVFRFLTASPLCKAMQFAAARPSAILPGGGQKAGESRRERRAPEPAPSDILQERPSVLPVAARQSD